jgi:hypothetical protein
MTTLTPRRAVLIGNCFVNGGVFAIIIACAVIGFDVGAHVTPLRTVSPHAFGAMIGGVIAWPWWAWSVPRWRDWVEDHGLKPEDVQELAVKTGLLWPEGSLSERTEFRRRDGRRGW